MSSKVFQGNLTQVIVFSVLHVLINNVIRGNQDITNIYFTYIIL